MDNSNKKNKYSFNVLETSEVIPNNDTLIDENLETENLDNDNENDISNFFYYDSEKIIQEYCLNGNYTAIYRDIGDNKLALLYEYERDNDGNEIFYIYTKDCAYIAIQSKDKLRNVFYVTDENFNLIENKDLVSSKFSKIPLLKNISEKTIESFTLKHSTLIVANYDFIDTPKNHALAKDFKHSHTKYVMASNLIPASTIIDEILSILHHYIATKELDKNELFQKYNELQNFSAVCPSSTNVISHLVDNFNEQNLKISCESLQSNLRNIENLIDMYLENELENEK